MRKSTLGAVVAAGLMAGGLSTSASAADFGGNCCADLEERIAELEATTARKGNRKVSLTISGFVAKQVVYWDDGFESNTYITDTGSVSIGTHVAFTGQATIVPGWTAGYVIKVELIHDDLLLVNQNRDDGPGFNAHGAIANGSASNIAIESSYWFIKSDQLGRLSVGQQSSAADNQAILPDGSGSLVQANYVLYDINGFQLRTSAGLPVLQAAAGANAILGGLPAVYGDLATCYPLTDSAGGSGSGGVAGDCDGYPKNTVRYDTPTFAGFSASASWGEDDDWAVSGRYAGEFGGFKIALAAAYNHTSDENNVGAAIGNLFGVADRPAGFEGSAWQVGGFLMHVQSGLFLYGAYAEEQNDSNTGIAAWDLKPEGEMWYVKAGIRQKWTPLGHTVLYGEYGSDDDKMSVPLFAAGVNSSELERYGIGVVQEIDAAAMSVWLAWRHYEPEVTCVGALCAASNLAVGVNDLEEFDLIKAGALISF